MIIRLVVAGCFLQVVAASAGDQLPEFQSCVRECLTSQCTSPEWAAALVLPLAAKFGLWTCQENCNYGCQQQVSQQRRLAGLPALQFYGKWPFRRLLGLTELASTIFSIANFYVNYVNLQKIARLRKSSKNPARSAMLLQYLVLLSSLCAGWLMSAVFHTRDTAATESLDYVGAGAIIVSNLNAVTVRFFHLYQQKRRRVRILVNALYGGALLAHYTRMYFSWDYGYNMRFSVVVGCLQLLLWLLLSLQVAMSPAHEPSANQWQTYAVCRKLSALGLGRRVYLPWVPLALSVFLIAGILALELHDFEPWLGVVDAHALWHVCTILPPIIWYDWNIWDLDMIAGWKEVVLAL